MEAPAINNILAARLQRLRAWTDWLPTVHHPGGTAAPAAMRGPTARACALFPPNVPCKTSLEFRVAGGFVLRAISLVVIASAVAGSLASSLGSASAQYYPPPPAASPPPPPYDARYDRPGLPGQDPEEYPPPGRP